MDTLYGHSVSILTGFDCIYKHYYFSLFGLGKPVKNDIVSFQQEPKEEGKLSTHSKVIP